MRLDLGDELRRLLAALVTPGGIGRGVAHEWRKVGRRPVAGEAAHGTSPAEPEGTLRANAREALEAQPSPAAGWAPDVEIERLTHFWKTFQRTATVTADTTLQLGLPPPAVTQAELFSPVDIEAEVDDEHDALFNEAVTLVRAHRTASTSFLQRKLRVGYSRAARLLDGLEAEGVGGPAQGNQPREVLAAVEEDGAEAGAVDEAVVPEDGPVRPWLAS